MNSNVDVMRDLMREQTGEMARLLNRPWFRTFNVEAYDLAKRRFEVCFEALQVMNRDPSPRVVNRVPLLHKPIKTADAADTNLELVVTAYINGGWQTFSNRRG